jgi:HSP90 family molecular chaperone
MKIPETYEEFLKTPKTDLKKLIESDNLSFEAMMTLYTFNNQAIEEEKNLPISEDFLVQKKELNYEDTRNI